MWHEPRGFCPAQGGASLLRLGGARTHRESHAIRDWGLGLLRRVDVSACHAATNELDAPHQHAALRGRQEGRSAGLGSLPGESTATELKAWRADRKVRRFLAQSCRPLRNRSAFHVDLNCIPPLLAELGNDWIRFLSSRGYLRGFGYFDLSDMVAVQILVGPVSSTEDFHSRYEELLGASSKTAERFLDATEAMLLDFAKAHELEFRQLADSTDPACVARKIEEGMRRRIGDGRVG